MIAGLPEELLNELTEAWTTGNRERVADILEDVANFNLADNLTRLALEYLLSNDDKLAEIFTAAGFLTGAENGESYSEADWMQHIADCADSLIAEVNAFLSELYNDGGSGFADYLCQNLSEGFDEVVISSILLYRVKSVLSPALLAIILADEAQAAPLQAV